MTGSQFRSIIETKIPFIIDCSSFNVLSGWGNVYDFGKRIAGLAAFVLFAASLFPIWVPGQSRLEYQVADNAEKIRALSSVPADLAVIKVQVAALDKRMEENSGDLNQIKNQVSLGLYGLLVGIISWLFNLFGGKVFKKL